MANCCIAALLPATILISVSRYPTGSGSAAKSALTRVATARSPLANARSCAHSSTDAKSTFSLDSLLIEVANVAILVGIFPSGGGGGGDDGGGGGGGNGGNGGDNGGNGGDDLALLTSDLFFTLFP
eukprot:CAMPEP_0175057710 /NCGR_PEP_ID=MMETSP0052_2-20121109/11416_1 /TAXON_ID=51329 ORGANISM="Polytomella parva, Strain SAG 63-3" /NCGR_SAMPLE_ID=MMETSP0052_2 /ASSEMBLY_ACC=CAM_ASM_000194 /LENGTH=125 /DNA_ID=CAMNT_0016322955 /DNA_START=732 /DNA_END=1106 /DNA_ORIENTATION=+